MTPPPGPLPTSGEGEKKERRDNLQSQNVATDLPILPTDWKWVRLGDLVDDPKQGLVDGPFGSNLKSSEYTDHGVPVFKIQNIKANRFVEKKMSFVTPEKADELKRHSFQAGDLIITKLGEPLGLCCKVPQKFPFGIIVADLMRLRPSRTKVFDTYLVNGINSDVVQKQFKTITKGTTRARVNLTIVRDISFPLPPLTTQHAIVAKIEELFSELDKGIESIKLAQQQLKTYRQSVLKAAFEGRLTDIIRQGFKPLPNETVNERDGELPAGWQWVKLDDVAEKITDGEHFRPKTTNSGVYFLSAKDVRENGVSFDDPLYISEKTAQKAWERCHPARGDILIVSRGATVGRMCIVNTDELFCLLGSVILIKAKQNVISSYLTYVLKSPGINRKIVTVSGATAQQAIYLRDIKNVELPLPPLAEQQAIVAAIESRLSVADSLEATLAQSLAQAEALRQSVLKQAFEGRLV